MNFFYQSALGSVLFWCKSSPVWLEHPATSHSRCGVNSVGREMTAHNYGLDPRLKSKALEAISSAKDAELSTLGAHTHIELPRRRSWEGVSLPRQILPPLAPALSTNWSRSRMRTHLQRDRKREEKHLEQDGKKSSQGVALANFSFNHFTGQINLVKSCKLCLIDKGWQKEVLRTGGCLDQRLMEVKRGFLGVPIPRVLSNL